MTVLGFTSQIVFFDKLLYINKIQSKNGKNAVDADGKPLGRITYAIAFHYDNGDVSTMSYSSEETRDKDYKTILKLLGISSDNPIVNLDAAKIEGIIEAWKNKN